MTPPLHCPLPPVCRPQGWAALWRRMGNLSVLNCSKAFSS